MAAFAYRGRDGSGSSVHGVIEAETAGAVASQLMTTGVTPIEITEAESAEPEERGSNLSRLLQRGPSVDELILFTRQMYSLTKSGVPLLRGLLSLAETTRNEIFAQTIRNVVEHLEAGRDLAGSLARYPKIFSGLYVNIVRVGENSGQLEAAFERLSHYLELEKRTRKQMTSALRYPAFVIIAIGVAITIITIYVIPVFAKVYESFKADLPWPTQAIIAVSNFTVAWWPALLLMLVGSIFGWIAFLDTANGRLFWDRVQLRLPVVGNIILRSTLARYARAFAMAQRSGVPLLETLHLVSMAVDNVYLGGKILGMRSHIEHGESLTRSSMRARLFTPLVLQMVAVGEETGNVDDMLDEVADYYEQEVDYDLQNLSALIEPILIIFVGILVLILALGVFLPMWDLARVAF